MRLRMAVPSLALTAAAAVVLGMEMAGVPTGMRVRTRGDVTREMYFLGQYGQFASVTCVVAAIWLLDRDRRPMILFLLAAVLATGAAASVVKVAAGRVRPSFENAGQFQGPLGQGGSTRRSFPSGHTAAAFALSAALVAIYPRGRGLFWTLAVVVAAERWTQNAHWLSDVLAGAALGIGVVHLFLPLARRRGSPPTEP